MKVLGLLLIFLCGCLAAEPRESTTGEPLPGVSILASHGYATVQLSGYRENGTIYLDVEGPDYSWHAAVPIGPFNASFDIPFLEAETDYRLTLTGFGGEQRLGFRTTPGPAYASIDGALVRPGIRIGHPEGSCTLAFLARNPTNNSLYAITAGHCGKEPGVRLSYTGGHLGIVVATGWPNQDWSVLELSPDARIQAHPGMLGWPGPREGTMELALGDRLLFYGQGDYTRMIGVQARHGMHVVSGGPTSDESEFTFVTEFAGPGDSGSPVVREGTFDPVGVIVSLDAKGGAEAIKVKPILDGASTQGLDLRILYS